MFANKRVRFVGSRCGHGVAMSDDDGPTYVNRGHDFPSATPPQPPPTGSSRDARRPEHGPVEGDLWPVEPGRYRLIAAKACPWATRALIVRDLLGLDDVISLGLAGPTHDERSWTFDLDPGGVDPVLGIERLRPTSRASRPTPRASRCRRSWTCRPGRWSPTTSRGSPTTSPSSGASTTAPTPLTCGPPTSARRWRRSCSGSTPRSTTGSTGAGSRRRRRRTSAATSGSGRRLDWLEERLATRRYLMGDVVTEADVRLLTTLARFDAVYHGHFKCNRDKLTEMPMLWAYARDLFQMPGFGDTIDFDQISEHYYVVHRTSTRRGSCPRAGPLRLADPHGRESLSGKPDEPTGRRHYAGRMGHDHGHAAGRAEDRARLRWVLAVTGTVLVVELVGAWLAGSLALLADAGHMATDAGAVVLALGASYVAALPRRAALDVRLPPGRGPRRAGQRPGAARRLRLPGLRRHLPAGRPARRRRRAAGRRSRWSAWSPTRCRWRS